MEAAAKSPRAAASPAGRLGGTWGLALAVLLLPMTGCIKIPAGSGGAHYLIIGVGVVTVPACEGTPAVEAVRARSLGFAASDVLGPRFSLGYASHTSVAIPSGADGVVVEVESGVFGDGIRVEAPLARLDPPAGSDPDEEVNTE